MLAIDILQSKKTYQHPTFGLITDLVTTSWNLIGVTLQIDQFVMVTEETQMRGDLIAQTLMGDQNYLGTLLKANGHSNPFSLELGDILFVPSKTSADNLITNGSSTNAVNAQTSFRAQLQDKLSKVSKERLNYLSARSISNIVSQPLPPNVQPKGSEQTQIIGGRLIFGADTGVSIAKAQSNVQKNQIKAKLASKKIFIGS